jgi:hypothetical protein
LVLTTPSTQNLDALIVSEGDQPALTAPEISENEGNITTVNNSNQSTDVQDDAAAQ